MPILGVYDMHLYCDGEDCKAFWQSCEMEQTESECRRVARLQGWSFRLSEHKCYCPNCSVKRGKLQNN